MRTMRWNKQRIIYTFITALIVYLSCKYRSYEYISEGHLKNVKANKVWEFFADFSNMEILLPDLESFKIISETGNIDHWRYVVKYTERSEDWPHLESVAIGNYSVLKEGETNYVVRSVHHTCFLRGTICLTSECDFTAWQNGHNSDYREILTYQCPWLLSGYCHKLTSKQRSKVFHNLRYHFKNTPR